MQGKIFSRGAWRYGMVWINVEINLEVDRWVMGWVYMSLGWSG